MNSIPLIELKVRSMEHSIIAALSDHEAAIAAEIKEGVKKALSGKSIALIVEGEALRIIRDEVIQQIKYETHKQFAPIVEAIVKAKVMKESKRLWDKQ